MRSIWVIARREYGVNFRRTGFQIMTWIVPALGLVALTLGILFSGHWEGFFERQFSPGEPVDRLALVDESGLVTPVLPEFEDWIVTASSRDEAEAMVADGTAEVYIVVGADYLTTGTVRVEDPEPRFGVPRVRQSELREFLVRQLLVGTDLGPELAERLADPLHLTAEMTDPDPEDGDPEPPPVAVTFDLTPFLFGFLLLLAIFTSSGYLLRGVSEEKNSRIIEILVSSVTPRELLLGKLMGLGGLAMTQAVIWMGSLVVLANIASAQIDEAPELPGFLGDDPGVLLLAAAYFLLGVVFYGVFFAAIGAVTNSMQEANQWGGFFSITAVLPFMFGGILIPNPHGSLAQALSYFPLTTPTTMLLRVGTAAVPARDIVLTLGLLAVLVVVVLRLGERLFARTLLMYGERPSLRELLRP